MGKLSIYQPQAKFRRSNKKREICILYSREHSFQLYSLYIFASFLPLVRTFQLRKYYLFQSVYCLIGQFSGLTLS